ncbi:hypothetical protein ACFWU3_30870 [Streptomyces sp. NPDC058685]|uniref:hypothetical protein n=1 Tax=Streptomyces sp. NPDC058685 TaxID=3346598 RepID=UPI0036490DA2
MVGQDQEGGLLLAAYVPKDIAADGTVSRSIVASLARDSPTGVTDGQALGAAAHMAGLDPRAALTLAALLETMAAYLDRAEELGDIEATVTLLAPAMRLLRPI